MADRLFQLLRSVFRRYFACGARWSGILSLAVPLVLGCGTGDEVTRRAPEPNSVQPAPEGGVRSLEPPELTAGAVTERPAVDPATADEPSTGERPPSRPFRIGVVDGDPAEVFGSIKSMLVNDSGVFVLDEQFLDLRWFDHQGILRGRAGGSGRGPGEFSQPETLAVDENADIHVVDSHLRRISVYRAGSEGLAHVRDYALALARPPFGGICKLGHRTFVASPTVDAIMHEVDSAGVVVRSFGEPIRFVDDPRIWADSIRRFERLTKDQNSGRILCDAAAGMVIFAHGLLPYVRAFAPDGVERWRTELRDHHRRHLVQGTTPTSIVFGFDPETGTAHIARSIFLIDDATVGIGLTETSLGDFFGKPEMRRLSRLDGRELEPVSLPFLAVGVHAGRLFGYVNSPFPQVFGVTADTILDKEAR